MGARGRKWDLFMGALLGARGQKMGSIYGGITGGQGPKSIVGVLSCDMTQFSKGFPLFTSPVQVLLYKDLGSFPYQSARRKIIS